MTKVGWANFAVLAAVVGPAIAFASGASTANADSAFPWLSEARIGGATTVPLGGGAVGTPLSASVELQLLFSPLPTAIRSYDSNLSWLFSPRPIIGASISAEGRTDTAYAGFAWDAPIIGPYFAEFSVGGLVHDQRLDQVYSDRPSPLGTRLLFHESVAVGRKIGPDWRIMAFADHASNGNLAADNVGINRVGVLLGRSLEPAGNSALEPLAQVPSRDLSASAFSWAGPYFGFGIGLATDQLNFLRPPSATDFKSVNLAGQFGYSWVIDRLVLGLEADGSAQNPTGSFRVVATGAAATARSRWLATARGRLGVDFAVPFAPYQFLLYGTGGAAFTDVVNNYCVTTCSLGGAYFDQQQFRTGWAAGGGVELPLAPAVTIKFEYLYADFGRLSFSNPVAAEQFTFSEQILRTGMNFKFNLLE